MEISRTQAWILASRPKTLSAATVPILVATALAFKEAGTASLLFSVYAFLASLFIQVGTNFINDALDYKKGTDNENRLGPMRVTQAGVLPYQRVLAGAACCFLLAFLCALPLVAQGGAPIFVALILALLCGYLYTGGPFPLGYYGMGDLFVLLFFGWVATLSLFYIQTGAVTLGAWVAGTQVGLHCTSMIAINNYRDIENDALSGKRTLAVLLGQKGAKLEIATLIVAPYLLCVYWIATQGSVYFLLPFLNLPLGLFLIQKIAATPPSHQINAYFSLNSLHYQLFGILFAFSLLCSTLLTG